MLRELFTKFDQKCQQNKVYKLYTIGDCYVVMGLINIKNRNYIQEAQNGKKKKIKNIKIQKVINLGFSMIEIIQEVRQIINYDELDMRIGIHTGNIIGGVVGTGVVRYDIYGPDVVIANKMESNGKQSRIMISENTYQLIYESCQDIYIFEDEGEVYISSQKRKIKTYFIRQQFQYENQQEHNSNISNKYSINKLSI
ncbi:hypothetical protein IMG5_076210 [Ichthyophthirius multifiliis]|uniref:adenylate cyclase n=1 Tax=Ichthyophthirius multifiliis TaxID=5932 RepID=G0QQ90_ICHMU|nr:hypothetical protein IMG5_076210 [Ichthyophthirius multifiliis]EGR32591.1 hypothetical protein IMG5_076210 [Ichthyophthirius multifiliis]|eukprot:XP_004036577.1 hypothetical protein IMG5_076210 [Ichthyophthirius multifiliis]